MNAKLIPSIFFKTHRITDCQFTTVRRIQFNMRLQMVLFTLPVVAVRCKVYGTHKVNMLMKIKYSVSRNIDSKL